MESGLVGRGRVDLAGVSFLRSAGAAARLPLRLLGPLRRRILVGQAPCRVVGAAKSRSLIGSGQSDIFEPGNISELLLPELPGRFGPRRPQGSTPAHPGSAAGGNPWWPSWRITSGAATLVGGTERMSGSPSPAGRESRTRLPRLPDFLRVPALKPRLPWVTPQGTRPGGCSRWT